MAAVLPSVNTIVQKGVVREQGGAQAQEEEFLTYFTSVMVSFPFLVKSFKLQVNAPHSCSIDIKNEGVYENVYEYNMKGFETGAFDSSQSAIISGENANFKDGNVSLTIIVNGAEGQKETKIINIAVLSFYSSFCINFKCKWLDERKPNNLEQLEDLYQNLEGDLDVLDTDFMIHSKTIAKTARTCGTAYANAYTKYQEVMTADAKTAEAEQKLLGDIFSLIGIGFISWLSTADKLSGTLNKLNFSNTGSNETLENVFEDVVQGGIDKTMPNFATINKGIKPSVTLPQEFQNNILNRTSDRLLEVLSVIFRFKKALVEKLAQVRGAKHNPKMIDMDTEWEFYKKVRGNYEELLAKYGELTSIKLLHKGEEMLKSLTIEMEVAIWDQWFGQQKIVTVTKNADNGAYVDVQVPSVESGRPILHRMLELNEKVGLGLTFDVKMWPFEDSLADEAKALIIWAQRYTPKRYI